MSASPPAEKKPFADYSGANQPLGEGMPPRILGGSSRALHLRRLIGAFAGIVFFGLALWALHRSLHGYRYEELVAALSALPWARVVLALALTIAGYLVLMGYDVLAFRFIGRPMPLAGIAAASFVSNALGNNFGNTLITGAAVRYWVYTSIGVTATQIARVVLFCSFGFWLGYLFLGAALFVFDPFALPAELRLGGTTTLPLGLVFVAVLAAYLALTTRRRPLWLWELRVDLPSPALTVGQIAVASLDICLMAAVLFVLLPPASELAYSHCLSALLIALVAGNASQVPGGLGVFESVMVLLLSPTIRALDLAAALLAFRAIYLILPLFVAMVFLAARESSSPNSRVRRWLGRAGPWLAALAPEILAAVTFVSGTVLLFSGALPAASGRLAFLHGIVALPAIEGSHFVASVTGAALLLLARGLQRRLDAAWLLAVALLATGAMLSLAKGWDFEEAMVLGATCLALVPFRRQFYRRSSLLGEPFTVPWTTAIVIVLGGSLWLFLLSHRQGAFWDEPWWQFSLHAEASRSLRATVGAATLISLFAFQRLIRPMRQDPPSPSRKDIERARPIVRGSAWTYANLVFRGDKALLFSKADDAFLMYGRMGRSWVAMGDPVGTDEGVRELVWRFRDLCDRFDGWCVFFEVRPDHRELYASVGLTLTPLGEEARLDLSRFSIDASEYKDLRYARSRFNRGGGRFEILPVREVPAVIPTFEHISERWLAAKATGEKGFSNASFDIRYLEEFPAAVVRWNGEIVAFANLWLGADKEELSVDLMRHLPNAPNGTMDFLFSELLLWGHAECYRWFNFGMAPLSGLGSHPGTSLWKHVGTFLFRHGEHFYNFAGLRRYKAKFRPIWTTRYLVSPGGLALPHVLFDVSALIAGGATGILSKRGARRRLRS